MLDALEFAMADLENVESGLISLLNVYESNEDQVTIFNLIEQTQRMESMLQTLWERRRDE